MIARLTGKLVQLGLTEIILDVHGVGYRLFIPMSTYDRIVQHNGKEVTLLIYTNVREDAIHLYGFSTEAEKKLFEMLISVSGIGAKIALNILSSMTVTNFCEAINNNDFKMVSRINGIGKKTAERLIIELRDKVTKISPEIVFGEKITEETTKDAEDAVMALEQLGFKRERAQKCVRDLLAKLPENEHSSENLIKQALQSLNK